MIRVQKYLTLFLFVATGWLAPLTTGAQTIAGLLVTGSDPANGAVAVPTKSQVTFTFSAPIDSSPVYSSGLPINLLDPNGDIAARISSYTLSPDQKSLTLDIVNSEDSDVALIVTAAVSTDGDALCLPYVLNYSTHLDSGTFSVSGWTYWPYYFFDMNGDGNIVPTITSINHPNNEVVFYDTDFDQVIKSITVTLDDLTDISPSLYYPQASEKNPLPEMIHLEALFPNPFFETLTVPFSLNVAGPVEISVFDSAGRRQYSKKLGVLPARNHVVQLSTSSLPGGQYFVDVRSMYSHHIQSVVHLRR